MKILKTHFSKNGLEYSLMKRNDKVALFQLGSTEYPDGYEVSRIYIEFEESEIISSNDQFLFDGSGAFRNLDNALKHFDKLTNKLLRKDNVEPNSPSDTELILECQAVGDKAN
jgi:hypothetical protein